MVSPVVVVVDEGRDLSLEVAGQEIGFQQDAVFESLVPALDFALRHWMIGRTAQMFNVAWLGRVVRIGRRVPNCACALWWADMPA